MKNNKVKFVNIRMDRELETKIKSIQSEMKKRVRVGLNRSQVIEMLITKGIEKYIDENLYPHGD